MTRRTRRKLPSGIQQLSWQSVSNPYCPIEVLTVEDIERIHQASLKLLQNDGLEFRNARARTILKEAGAEVDEETQMVRFDPDMVVQHIAHAPSHYTVHARNPQRNVLIGGNNITFSPVGSAPNASDLDRGRRTGNFEDYCNFIRMGHTFNCIHLMSGYPVEPIDIPVAYRHLDALAAFYRLSDKVGSCYSLGRQMLMDSLELTRIVFGLASLDELAENPRILTVINTNSPRRVDKEMLEGVMHMASYNQVQIITPFTLLGAMAPTTIAGALVQQNAEALGVIALAQIIRPGAPIVYGSFSSNVDMKSGAPAFGTPEYIKTTLASGQIARYYGFPFRTSNANASNLVDAQSTYESAMSLWAAIMGHGNMIKHSAGWIEGGLTASFEKYIVDIEMIQTMMEFLKPPVIEDETIALDAISEVEPGGHFFANSLTLKNYDSIFYQPFLSDWSNFENWQEKGATDTTTRANRIYKEVLKQYETPLLDPAIAEEMTHFCEKRKQEIRKSS